jgi:hypothetical protein
LLGSALTLGLSWMHNGGTHERKEIHAPFDEEEVRRVVKESQFFETLTVYTKPKTIDPGQLNEYWVPVEQGGKEIEQVQASIGRLLSKGWHYGPESKSELFEFRYVRIFDPGDSAEAGTIERWYVPTHNEDGSLVADRNVHIGPLQIDYKLRKINGAWLIQENTTPRPRKQ